MPELGHSESPTHDRERGKLTPIFILGPFHSATTILYRMLAMHPDTTWFSQFSLRDGSIPERRRLPLHRHVDRISRRLFNFDWEKRGETRRDFFVARPTEGQLIWQYIIPPDGSLEMATSVNRLRHLLGTESRGNKRFLAKYPYLTLHLPILRASYPAAKFLHIVRDGRAVALSLKGYLLEAEKLDYIIRDGRVVPLGSKDNAVIAQARGYPPVNSEEEALARAANYWLQCIRMIQAEKNHIDLCEIRYEDLCEDLHGHLAKVLGAVGLDVDSFPFHQCPSTLAPTNGKWIKAASPGELQALENLLDDELRLYSYV